MILAFILKCRKRKSYAKISKLTTNVMTNVRVIKCHVLTFPNTYAKERHSHGKRGKNRWKEERRRERV